MDSNTISLITDLHNTNKRNTFKQLHLKIKSTNLKKSEFLHSGV